MTALGADSIVDAGLPLLPSSSIARFDASIEQTLLPLIGGGAHFAVR